MDNVNLSNVGGAKFDVSENIQIKKETKKEVNQVKDGDKKLKTALTALGVAGAATVGLVVAAKKGKLQPILNKLKGKTGEVAEVVKKEADEVVETVKKEAEEATKNINKKIDYANVIDTKLTKYNNKINKINNKINAYETLLKKKNISEETKTQIEKRLEILRQESKDVNFSRNMSVPILYEGLEESKKIFKIKKHISQEAKNGTIDSKKMNELIKQLEKATGLSFPNNIEAIKYVQQ